MVRTESLIASFLRELLAPFAKVVTDIISTLSRDHQNQNNKTLLSQLDHKRLQTMFSGPDIWYLFSLSIVRYLLSPSVAGLVSFGSMSYWVFLSGAAPQTTVKDTFIWDALAAIPAIYFRILLVVQGISDTDSRLVTVYRRTGHYISYLLTKTRALT